MALTYEEKFTVFQFECDPWDRMTPGAALRRIQECSTAQCELLGLNEALYRKTHTVFLLSRTSLEVERMPLIGNEVTIETRAYMPHRAVYQRMTTLYDGSGAKLCEADARWVLVDTNTWRILRREPEDFSTPMTDPPGAEEHSMEVPPHGDLQPVTELPASYTLCDRNRHVNNSRYADIVCDCLPLDMLEKGPLKKLLLFYRSEIAMGSRFSMSVAPAGDGYFFTATQGETKNFEAYASF